MKNTVARSGVDIAINGNVTEIYSEHFTISSPDQDASLYHLSFNGFHSITTLNTGERDTNEDGTINHLSLDVGLFNNEVMMFAESPDLTLSTDFTVDSIVFCNENIGSLIIKDMNLSSFHLIGGPHLDNGISYEFGFKLSVNSFKYTYNSIATSGFLGLDGITFSDGAKGEFLIGNLAGLNPATIDIVSDDTAEWILGANPPVANPRNGTGYISMNLPMQGSIHIDSVALGGNNFGSLAIDGINVEKLYIEIPGRGLGK